MSIEHITDHIARALANLPSRHRDSERLREFISILVAEAQELEDTLYDCIVQRLLETAEGAQLDQYGLNVLQGRLGLVDADYRKLLRVRISANLSHGLAREIVAIAGEMIDAPVRYRQIDRAHFSLEWLIATPITAAWTAVFVDLINYAIPSGVSWHAIEGPAIDAYTLDSGPALDVGKLSKTVYS